MDCLSHDDILAIRIMSKKQATLFQSWGTKAKGTVDKPAQHCPQPSTSSASDEVIDLCGSFEDGDDDILCEAEESAANESKSIGETFKNKDDFREVDGNEVLETHLGDISIGAEGFTPTQVQTQSSICPGFDKYAGKLWIYPTNYPVREYQFNIVQQALFKNTMVTLPTGLGKTFIAAVVMYNFYRWYPQGKVIFMAPTKPLVAQQIEACYNIMGIPQDHTAEMTGTAIFYFEAFKHFKKLRNMNEKNDLFLAVGH